MNKKIIKILKKVLGEKSLGRLDYYRYPNMRNSWGGPFNGQKFRQCIFFEILYHYPIQAIVETGTYRGTTTSLFAATSLPVYSVESDKRNYAFSKSRFLFNSHKVYLSLDDSREFLNKLSRSSTTPKEAVFFYLDAHWGGDLPLNQELDIIFSNWTNPIVMIDDFCVPNSEYQYDNYGADKILNLDYLASAIEKHNISTFFPAIDSSKETGALRGCVVLSRESENEILNTKVSSLIKIES